MVDVEKAVVEHIEVYEALIEAALGASIRVYGSVDPPKGYNPADDGPCITLGVRGGAQDYSGAIVAPSMQVRCWGATENLAKKLDKALFESINHTSGALVLQCFQEVLGQVLVEPGVDWPFVLSYWKFVLRNQT